jgi:hypothetical protein
MYGVITGFDDRYRRFGRMLHSAVADRSRKLQIYIKKQVEMQEKEIPIRSFGD